MIAQRIIGYGRQWLDEMELYGITEPAPPLVLKDELTHTNAPGSRHPKRYLDVQKLAELRGGVSTILYFQHMERLNDAVAQIARIRVLETVPDSVPNHTGDIEIMDTTPADPIKRLDEGKFYLSWTARCAISNYFSRRNLTCGSGNRPSAPVEAGLKRQYRRGISAYLYSPVSTKYRRMPVMPRSNQKLCGSHCCDPIWRKTVTLFFLLMRWIHTHHRKCKEERVIPGKILILIACLFSAALLFITPFIILIFEIIRILDFDFHTSGVLI